MQFFRQVRLLNRKQSGVSLVEILLVIAVIGFLGLLIGNLPNSIGLIGKAKRVSLAREIASAKIESLRQTGFVNLSLGESAISDSRLTALPESFGKALIEDCDSLVCTQAESAKQITVTVSWKDLGKDQEVKIKTLISEGGL